MYGFAIGDLTVQNADWDIVAQHAAVKAQQAMTARTQLAISALEGASLPSGNVIDVSGTYSSTWAASTTTSKTIRKSLTAAAEKILDNTLAAVDVSDLVVVINSNLAKALAECDEIVDYIKGSPEALAQIRGELPGRNVIYGLPNKLFGFELVVEDTRKVTSKRGSTKNVSQILPNDRAYMIARVGGLEGLYGGPNFSSLVCFALRDNEFRVETRRDEDNKRTVGRIIDTICYKVVCPAATVRFTNCQ